MKNIYIEKLQTLIQQSKFKPRTFNELREFLEIRNAKKERQLNEAVEYLCSVGTIVEKKKRYMTIADAGFIKGEVIRSTNGYMFIREVKTEKEYFVPPSNTKGAMIEDKVLFEVVKELPNQDVKGKQNSVAHIREIISREKKFLVGTYIVDNGRACVNVETKHMKEKIWIDNSRHAVEGHEVVIKLNDKNKWEVCEVLGHKDEPTTEILSLLYNFGIKAEFNKETLEEAEAISQEVPEYEYYIRRDLRQESIVTIDGSDAKDLDDAVHLTINERDNYLLSVHIADVSYYIERESSIEREAYERGTSVYLTNKVVPMLPQRLSNGICSLLPNVPRLTISCEMEIDKLGNVLDYNIFDSVIQTKARLTYEEVNQLFKGNIEVKAQYPDIQQMLKEMNTLSKVLQKRRYESGSINFELKEAKVIIDENNVPTDIKARERGDAEKLIEEFMLIANETIAKHFAQAQLPFIYRVHDAPNEDKIILLSNLVSRMGYPELTIDKGMDPKQIQRLINGIKDKDLIKVIHTLGIRAMSKAIYSEDNIGHYGLSKEFYTHFTSPIRRYPDLLVHRLIREFFLEHNITKKNREYWAKILPKSAEHASRKEQRAAEAERELLEIKKIEYMSAFEGLEFEGIISNVTEQGFYVELDNTIQGFVLKENISSELQFKEGLYALIGPNETYVIGDKVQVILEKADKHNKKIHFQLKKHGI